MAHALNVSGLIRPALAALCIAWALSAAPVFADTPTTATHHVDSVNGFTLTSAVSYDSGNNWNIFNYSLDNSSGETVFQAKYFGQDWVGGGGTNLVWAAEIVASAPADPQNDYIRFYDNSLDNGLNEDWIVATSFVDSWGIGLHEFKTIEGGTYYLEGLKPMFIPEPATVLLLLLAAPILTRRRHEPNDR